MDYIPLQDPTHSSHRGRFWYHAFVHALSVLLAATAVALFPAFSYKPWSLPTTYPLKTTQQYLNFIVVALALLLSSLLQHCLAITNNTEVEAEFASKSLTLAALQARAAANGKDVIDMLRYASRNARLWRISGPFAVAIFAFSAMSWVLSIVFVIDAKLLPHDKLTTVPVSLGADIPTLPDACRGSLTAEGCTYDLAMSALTSQLITHTPYTFNNVTFSGPEGTRALPVGVMQNFADQAVNSTFGQEMSRYCLPLLRPNLVNCSTAGEGRAKYVYMSTVIDTFLDIPYDTYSVIINPDTDANQTYVLTSSNDKRGVMAVAHSEKKGEIALSILTGSGQYADLLSKLATGQDAPFTKEKYNETTYTVLCEAPFDDTTYSWNWVEFSLNGGVMTANMTDDTCRENKGKSPMVWLDYALEGATSSAQLRDGYSKLLNTDYLSQTGADYERMKAYGMSPLEYILSHIEAIVQTAWTAVGDEHLDLDKEELH
ncbi:Hypothetical predicted protein [Lecanosticta acicola]|uniref:Uncharacterized protein n=1 Tax=Lecanosticta acicola TaxID=111012 RepID=A0AAI8Z6S0_9PEZI|nr:Hypothetical predicted protein [Lecanosticta acicola]